MFAAVAARVAATPRTGCRSRREDPRLCRGDRRRGRGTAALPADLVPRDRRGRRAPRRRRPRRHIGGIVERLGGIVAEGSRQSGFRPVNPLHLHAGIVAPLLLFFASAGFRQRLAARRDRRRRLDRGEVVAHMQRVALASLGRAHVMTTDCASRHDPGHRCARGRSSSRRRRAVEARRPAARASGYVEATEVRVAPEVGGRVLELAVAEGDRSTAGDVDRASRHCGRRARAPARARRTATRPTPSSGCCWRGARRGHPPGRGAGASRRRPMSQAAEAELAAAEPDLQRFEAAARRPTPARASSATMR